MGNAAGPGHPDPSGPCWLTADEQATWLALGTLVTRLPAAVDADLRAASAVSLFEYLVLANLSEAPERTLRMTRAWVARERFALPALPRNHAFGAAWLGPPGTAAGGRPADHRHAHRRRG